MSELTVLFFIWGGRGERGQNSLIRFPVEVLRTHSDNEICSERTWEVSIYGGDAPLVSRSLQEIEGELGA